MHRIALITAGLAAASATLPVNGAPTYTAIPLGMYGGAGNNASDINDAGQLTGFTFVTANAQLHAIINTDGILHDLGTLGGLSSFGTGINSNGQVAGYGDTTPTINAWHAFLYSNGVMTDLGTLGGRNSNSGAQAINNSGQVTGYSETAAGGRHAFLYAGGGMIDLGVVGGAVESWGYGINATGQVTGVITFPPSIDVGDVSHVFFYSNGIMTDLGTLGGTFGVGAAINDRGQVTGTSTLKGSPSAHAFLYSDGAMYDLGTLGGQASDESSGAGINASAQVVGNSFGLFFGEHAFLYDGTMHDLNLLVVGAAGTVLANAAAINDSGQIAAWGCSAIQICQGFRLDPVPTVPPPPTVNKLAAIEFYYVAFDHYFITAIPSEIAALDNGTFPGWVRTGEQFNVYSGALSQSASVYRFFSTAFAPKSSHFYTADPGEYMVVMQNGGWQFEGDVMNIPVPDSAGNCAAGTQSVYRLYNNGQGGAPSHRFTTNPATRTQMLAQGWIAEGYGNDGVIMCSPL